MRHFLERSGAAGRRVSLPYMVGLAHYRWPYNVRELESAVKLSLALSDSKPDAPLDLAQLPEPIHAALAGHGDKLTTTGDAAVSAGAPSARGGRGAPTEQELRELLRRHQGNIAAVGRSLSKERMQIHRWMKRYAIDPDDYRR